MNHKMVNLCDDSLVIACKMKNFSKWVRDELLKVKAIQEAVLRETLWYRCPACWKSFKEQAGKQQCLNGECGYSKELELIE